MGAEIARHAADDLERTIRRALREGEHEHALSIVDALAEADVRRAAALRLEAGFARLPDPDRSLIAALWNRIAVGNTFRRDAAERPVIDIAVEDRVDVTVGELFAGGPPEQAPSEAPRAAGPSRFAADSPPGFVHLARNVCTLLFGGRMPTLRAGLPFHGMEFRAPLKDGAIRCHVLFKDQKKPLDLEAVAPTVLRLAADPSARDVDYLVAPEVASSDATGTSAGVPLSGLVLLLSPLRRVRDLPSGVLGTSAPPGSETELLEFP